MQKFLEGVQTFICRDRCTINAALKTVHDETALTSNILYGVPIVKYVVT